MNPELHIKCEKCDIIYPVNIQIRYMDDSIDTVVVNCWRCGTRNEISLHIFTQIERKNKIESLLNG